MEGDDLVERHAALLVATGVKIEPGDRLVIWAEGDVLELARSTWPPSTPPTLRCGRR